MVLTCRFLRFLHLFSWTYCLATDCSPQRSNVIKLRNACFYPHYCHKLILFALSPLRLEQACASLPPSRRGAISVACSFVFKLTAEISVIAQISVNQVTVVSCVSVQKSEMLLSKPPSGRGEGWRRLVPSAGGRARIQTVSSSYIPVIF